MNLSQTYETIPLEIRNLLDEVYKPEGVVLWWNAKNPWLNGHTPQEHWEISDDDVWSVAASLLGQVAT